MMPRLVLSTVGIKSPVDVRPDPRAARRRALNAPPSPAAAGAPAQDRRLPSGTRRSLKPRPVISDPPRVVTACVALDRRLVTRIEETARVAGVPVDALAVAALTAGMPAKPAAAHELMADQPIARPEGRVKRNLHLPARLRDRADDLATDIRRSSPHARRSDVINAAMRRGLPATPQRALALVIVTDMPL